MLDVRNWLKVVETGTRKQKISVQKKKQLIKEKQTHLSKI